MNNVQFNNNNLNLLQNSEEFKLILYKFSSNMYDLARYNQPMLLITSLVFFVVFITVVYLLDSKKLKSQINTEKTDENTNEIINESVKEEKPEDETIMNSNTVSNIDVIKSEIIELKKELENLKINKNHQINTENEDAEDAEDFEDSNKKLSKVVNDNSSDLFDKTNMEKTISNMTISEIETFLQICSNHVLIPNWYTKEDFEGLTNTKLSTKSWEKILSGSDDYSSLIDETNAMTVGWFENNVESQIEKIPFALSVIEDSDEESSVNDSGSDSDDSESTSDTDETEQLNLLDNDDSDEEGENNVEDSDEEGESNGDETNDIVKPNIFITKQLEKLKYPQLKKIAGVTNNKLSKSQLVKLIAKDYKKVSIIKALNFIK